jgi:hypothetical protein
LLSFYVILNIKDEFNFKFFIENIVKFREKLPNVDKLYEIIEKLKNLKYLLSTSDFLMNFYKFINIGKDFDFFGNIFINSF